MPPETVAIAADHAGVSLKQRLQQELGRMGMNVMDFGTDSDESVDYPDFAAKVAAAVADGQASRGVLVCGTGIGMSIAANRMAGVRAALCCDREMAMLARQHNDANVLCLGARLMSESQASECLRTFMETEFEGGRHARRVAKMG